MLLGKTGLVALRSTAKAKLLLVWYGGWLAAQLRKGKTTLVAPLPTAEPMRMLVEKALLAVKPFGLTVFLMRTLYCTGGASLLRKLFALPTEVSLWVPLSVPQRRLFQSPKKMKVADPFSLLIEPPSNAAEQYERLTGLARQVKELRTTESKKLDQILEVLEGLSTRNGNRKHDNSVVTALIAANFHLCAAKPALSQGQQVAQAKAEQHRIEVMHGKSGAADAAKTEAYLRGAAEEGMVSLVKRRFDSPRLREVLLYVMGGCNENAMRPSAPSAVFGSEVTLESLLGSDSTEIAADVSATDTSAVGGVIGGAPTGRRRGGGARGYGQPRGVEVRRGPGEGFVAGLNLAVYLSLRVASHSPSTFWSMLLCAPTVLATSYVPTMAGDEFAMILAASDFVGWYKCPNGKNVP